MPSLAGAVDLSKATDAVLSPAEATALLEEQRLMARTRELALRREAVAIDENEGLHKLLGAIALAHGTDDGQGKRYLHVTPEMVGDAQARIVAVAIDPAEDGLHVVVTERFPGKWRVTRAEPTEQEQDLPLFETLPEIVTVPGEQKAIVSTRKGLRVAVWEPA